MIKVIFWRKIKIISIFWFETNDFDFCDFDRRSRQNSENRAEQDVEIPDSNRPYLAVDASSDANSFEIGKRRLIAFQIRRNPTKRPQPTRDTADSKSHRN